MLISQLFNYLSNKQINLYPAYATYNIYAAALKNQKYYAFLLINNKKTPLLYHLNIKGSLSYISNSQAYKEVNKYKDC